MEEKELDIVTLRNEYRSMCKYLRIGTVGERVYEDSDQWWVFQDGNDVIRPDKDEIIANGTNLFSYVYKPVKRFEAIAKISATTEVRLDSVEHCCTHFETKYDERDNLRIEQYDKFEILDKFAEWCNERYNDSPHVTGITEQERALFKELNTRIRFP